MPYMDNIWRSFRISWRHKYLWLIALFAGEGGGGGGGGFNGGGSGGGRTTGGGTGGNVPAPDLAEIQDQVTRFLADYAALIVLTVIVLLVLAVLFFILAAICQGATVRASAEHDADRPWDLGRAWTAGVLTMWPVIRFRLLIVALGLPILLLAIGLTAATIIAFANDNVGLGVALLVISLLLLLPVIAYGIYLHILDRLGSRALVLDQLGARASIVRAHRLLLKRLGRTLLVWLLSIAVAFVLGIVTACAFAIVFLPLVLAGSLFAANNSSAVVPLIVLGAIVALPISLLVAGFLSAQSSTYWTLAFRRLDLDPVPVAYNPQMPPPTAPA